MKVHLCQTNKKYSSRTFPKLLHDFRLTKLALNHHINNIQLFEAYFNIYFDLSNSTNIF